MTETPFDSLDFRQTMGTFCTGITIVTSLHESQVHGMTANAFTSVSLDPPLILVSVDKRADTHRYLTEAKQFGVSVLLADQLAMSNHFAGKPDEVVTQNLEYDWIDQIPVLRRCLANMACTLWATYDGGDHTLFVGRVVGLHKNDGEPLLYYGSAYHTLGKA